MGECTATSDTICMPCTECPSGKFVSSKCSATMDTVCASASCDVASLIPSGRPGWRYDVSECYNLGPGASCSISCAVSNATVTKGGATCNAVAMGDPFVASSISYPDPDCPSVAKGWSIDKSNAKCSGIPTFTVPLASWSDCVDRASSSCMTRISWDSVSRTCYIYSYFNCSTLVDAKDFYTMKFVGPQPFFPVNLKSWSRTSSNTRTAGTTYTYTFSVDTKNCVDQVATGFVWWNVISIGQPDERPSSTNRQGASFSVVLTSKNITSVPMWVKVQPMTTNIVLDDNMYFGPESKACMIVDANSGTCN